MEKPVPSPSPPLAALGFGALAALGLTLLSAWSLAPDQVGSGIVLILAAFVMGVRPVRLPQLKVAIAPIHFFILVAMIELGLLPALAAAFAGATGAALAPERPFRSVQVIFNLLGLGLSTLAAFGAILAVRGLLPSLGESVPAAVIAATVAFAVANSFLVAWVISIDQRRAFSEMWLSALFCESWCHPLGCLVTISALMVLDVFSLIVFSMVVSAIWLGFAVYRGRNSAEGRTYPRASSRNT